MSYFDHVRCHACRATLAPESLGSPGGGAGLQCPKCGAALNLQDLFGLGDAFVEDEEAPVSLDDLVAGPRPSAPPPARTAPAPAPAARPARPALPGPVPSGRSGPAADEPAPGSALEAIRALKKKR